MQGFSAGITQGCRFCDNKLEDWPVKGRVFGTLAKPSKISSCFPAMDASIFWTC